MNYFKRFFEFGFPDILFASSFLMFYFGYFVGIGPQYIFGVFDITMADAHTPALLFLLACFFVHVGYVLSSIFKLPTIRLPFISTLLTRNLLDFRSLSGNFLASHRFSLNSFSLLWLVIVLLALIILFIRFISLDPSLSDASQRLFVNSRITPFLLLIFSFLGPYSISKLRSKFLCYLFCISSFLFVSLFTATESSRQGLLYSGSFLIYCVFLNSLVKNSRRLKFLSTFSILQFVFSFVFFLQSRTDFFNTTFTLDDVYHLLSFVEYPTGFSLGNFIQQYNDISFIPEYSTFQLLLDLQPLPVGLLSFSEVYERYDFARSVCGAVRLISHSYIAYIIYWSLFGYLYGISRTKPYLLFLITLILLSLSFLMSFQYTPRAMFRYFSLAFMVLLVSPSRFSSVS